MYKLKDKRGITMVSLVITMIVLVILAGVSITFGNQSIKETIDAKVVTELNMVQHAVLEQYSKYKLTKDASYLVGSKLEDEDVNTIAVELGVSLVNIPDTYENKDYYFLDAAALTKIGIKDSKDEYIVNYISGEVINITKKTTSSDEPLYVKANSF